MHSSQFDAIFLDFGKATFYLAASTSTIATPEIIFSRSLLTYSSMSSASSPEPSAELSSPSDSGLPMGALICTLRWIFASTDICTRHLQLGDVCLLYIRRKSWGITVLSVSSMSLWAEEKSQGWTIFSFLAKSKTKELFSSSSALVDFLDYFRQNLCLSQFIYSTNWPFWSPSSRSSLVLQESDGWHGNTIFMIIMMSLSNDQE